METKPAETPKTASKMKVYVLVGLVTVLILVIAAIGYKTMKSNSLQQLQHTTMGLSNPTSNNSAISPTPTSIGSASQTNNSNAQLDQDVRNIQGNLDQLKNDQQNTDQSVQDRANDTPQQQ